jgi:hypothetical protein
MKPSCLPLLQIFHNLFDRRDHIGLLDGGNPLREHISVLVTLAGVCHCSTGNFDASGLRFLLLRPPRSTIANADCNLPSS